MLARAHRPQVVGGSKDRREGWCCGTTMTVRRSATTGVADRAIGTIGRLTREREQPWLGPAGAALGILRQDTDEVMAAPTGVLNVDIEVATTDDSVFQIGSITKVWNTTLVMQLVDDGLINLDAPIVEVLPELQLSNQQVAGRVTMRHLFDAHPAIGPEVATANLHSASPHLDPSASR